MLVLLVHPRSEQYHLSLGHLGTSHYASTSRTSQVRAVSFVLGTSWDIPGFPTMPVYTSPTSQVRAVPFVLGISWDIPLRQYFSYIPGLSSNSCPWDILGHPRTSHYASTSRTSQVRAVPFVLETSWDFPVRPTMAALLMHVCVYITKWYHCPRNVVGYLKTFRTFMYKSYLSGPHGIPNDIMIPTLKITKFRLCSSG